jgi:MFS family permease
MTAVAHLSRHQRQNIRLTMMFTVLAFAGRSIWSQSVLAAYVFLLSHNPTAVGFLTAVMGILQLLSSIPTGYLSDRRILSRDILLKVASAVGMLAMAVTVTALYLPEHQHNLAYLFLTLSLAVWGIFWGISNTALGALFADATPEGTRSKYFTQRSILINVGNTAGPLLALALFVALGDEWSVRDCAYVMALGQAVSFPAVALLCCFADDDVDDENEDTASSTTGNDLEEPLLLDDNDSNDVNSSDFESGMTDDSTISSSSEESIAWLCKCQKEPTTEACASNNVYGCIPKKRLAPALICIADVTSGLASGMSIRYFPIFFVDRLHLSPVQVQILYIVAPLVQACLMKSGQYFSQTMGRCQVTILHRWTGIACMIMLIVLAHYYCDGDLNNHVRALICVIFVIRTGFMNSTSALTKSLLMDSVPTQERGRWTALESVNMFSWSGSAFLGGILVNVNGLLFNFSITAALQFLSTIPIVFLMLNNKPRHLPRQ